MRQGSRACAIAVCFAALASTGCPLQPTSTAIRADYHSAMWPGDDLAYLADEGDSVSVEVLAGDDTQAAMGPFYLGGSYSQMRMLDSSVLHRLGIRARSSMLDRVTSSYPYATIGVYTGWLDAVGYGNKFGMGIEGGYGFRLGAGRNMAADVEVLFEWGYFENAFSIMSTRLGAGIMFAF